MVTITRRDLCRLALLSLMVAFDGRSYRALDRTAELLAKLLSGSEDPEVTALSEAVKAKLGNRTLAQASTTLTFTRIEHVG